VYLQVQVIITWNNNKSVPGFSQVQAIKRREIIYLLCLPELPAFVVTFLREEKEGAMLTISA